MKLLLVFALLALICMARSAPAPSTTPRKLILPDYHETDEDTEHDGNKVHDDETHVDMEAEEEDDDTTTTTTTTRRSSYAIPTRNRNLIPSRRPIFNQRTSSVRTITTTTTTAAAADDEEHGENGNEYDGDFKYIRDFRKYIQKLMEDIKKLVQNLTGYNFNNTPRQQYNQNYEDE